MKKTTAITLAAITGLSTIAIAGEGEGDIILEDGNSAASFNSEGQFSWTVDGVDHLYAQEFYFRLAGDNDEMNLNTLTLLGQAVNDTNPFSDDRDDSISALYGDSASGLEVETIFTLRGGNAGSGQGDLAEQIALTNNGNQAITLSFFQFVDFDLGGDSSDDSGMIVDGNIAQQSDDEFSISEVVVTPQPTLFQIDNLDILEEIFGNGSADDLNGNASIESTDVAWAFQWNITLEVGDSFLISKNKSIVPAPGSMALLAAGGLFATRRRRA